MHFTFTLCYILVVFVYRSIQSCWLYVVFVYDVLYGRVATKPQIFHEVYTKWKSAPSCTVVLTSCSCVRGALVLLQHTIKYILVKDSNIFTLYC